jgi:CubicO group peptidase (beta-lactamase class C family)
MAATVVVERLSQQYFTSFMSSRIFRPLHMAASTYFPDAATAAGRHAQSFTPDGRRIPNWVTPEDVRLNAGAGGVISSAEDMARWVRLLLGRSGEDADRAVPRAALEECMAPQAAILHTNTDQFPADGTITYGFGWMQFEYGSHKVPHVRGASDERCSDRIRTQVVQHSGGIPGMSTLVTLLPGDGAGVVQLANAHDLAALNAKVVRLIADKMIGPRRPWDTGIEDVV